MRRGFAPRSVAAAAAAAGFVFLLVWQQIQSVRVGYRLDEARRAVLAGRGRAARLRVELERLRSPAALAEAARRRLDMADPTPESLVELGEARPAGAGLLARAPGGARSLLGRLMAQAPRSVR